MERLLFIDKSDRQLLNRVATYLKDNPKTKFLLTLMTAVDGKVKRCVDCGDTTQLRLKLGTGAELLSSCRPLVIQGLSSTEDHPYAAYHQQIKEAHAIFAHVHEIGFEDLLSLCDPSTLFIRLSRDHLLEGFVKHGERGVINLDRSFTSPEFSKDLVELINIALNFKQTDGYPQNCPARLRPFLAQPRHALRALMLLVQAMLVADIENRPQKDEIARALGLPDWVSTDLLRNPDVANFAFLRSGLIKPNASPSRSPDAYPVIAETTVPNLLSTNELLQCMLQRDTLTEAEWALCFAAYKELKDTFHL